ncbi:hypothetical protein HYZ78_01915 [Candidatus Microgenomates bacterium]|nr:hypothetical protein [Candidatus Microgenomates bacterium]
MKTLKILLLLPIAYYLLPTKVLAQTRDFTGDEVQDGVATIKGFEAIFYNLVAIALALAGIVLFIMLIVGGFKFMTAGDNADQAKAAQQTLTYGLFGFVLIVSGFLILKLIEQFTGVPVTLFKVIHN